MNLQRDKGGCTLLNLILTRYEESHRFQRVPEGSLDAGRAVCDHAGEDGMCWWGRIMRRLWMQLRDLRAQGGGMMYLGEGMRVRGCVRC